ncbi:putative aspartate aminotransferase, cytoplasmic 2 [Dunckerocampus dactyliophorus]|uniref:putative aspartate aminotransferase, cytoplasmic 2 n=1 Tax=Dunckerocampus dactyliophorus TaxID=161453 RepID=UPI002406EF88|nr:putative aspartate aminotransferase, cytoplasmic 2 [Dunckerocampus dactyliophorus]
MSLAGCCLDKKWVVLREDPAGDRSASQDADVSPETSLLCTFRKDTHADKVYLAGREYFGEDGQTFSLRLVEKIKQQLKSDPTLRPDTQCPSVQAEFCRRATEAALGNNSKALLENRVLSVHAPSFSGAVRLGAELLRYWFDVSSAWDGPVYLSSPCDDSLAATFRAAGFHDIRHYYYWDDEQRDVCLKKLFVDLQEAPERSVILLPACGHYPTGAALSHNQWVMIAQLILRRGLRPFLLLPTPAFCCGDLDHDAWPVWYFASQGMELLCAQSFSHCFGLYGEAVSHLLCVLKHNSVLSSLRSQADKLSQSLWAQLSVGGARVVSTLLSNPAHLVEWQGEVKRIVERCLLIRQLLREKLRLLGSPGWDHVTQQSGLYCCLGLNAQQVDFLSNRRHVYVLPHGCINVSTINSHNLDYIAESVHAATTSL